MSDLTFDVNCTYCKKSLMDPYRMIKNKPSIRLIMKTESVETSIRLSSIYGDYEYITDVKLKKGDVVDFFCPSCKANLISKEECVECHAPMVDLRLAIGGKVCFCSRNGCKNHSVGFVDMTSALSTFYDKYKYDKGI